ncbi:MAG: hypothetical protein GY827_10310 [Cytophagales bacterium]|nr:hypothetical protein [Cytophagales bacterium]
MKHLVNSLIFLSLSIVIWACASQKAAKEVVEKPLWVKNHPTSSFYYVGVGHVNKKAFPYDYQEAAKKKALDNLSHEIKTTVNSESIMHQTDQANSFREGYMNHILLTSQEEIEGHELVNTWENENEYWVYYQLNKQDYQAKKKEKHQLALKTAKGYFTKAQIAEKQGEVRVALNLYTDCLKQLEKHLHLDNGGLDIESLSAIQNIINKIDFKLSKTSFKTSDQFFPVLIQFKGKKASQIPVQMSMPNVFEDINTKFSDVEGKIFFKINKKEGVYTWKFSIEELKKRAGLYSPIAKLLNTLTIPERKELIKAQKEQIALRGIPFLIKPKLSKTLETNHFSVTNNTNDWVCSIQKTEQEQINGQGFHVYYLNMNIVFKKNGAVFFEQKFTAAKGVHLNKNQAVENAYKEAIEELENEILPSFFRKLEN